MKRQNKLNIGVLICDSQDFISAIEFNKYFFDLLRTRIKVTSVLINNKQSLENVFEKIEKQPIDYIYIDSFSLLTHLFLLREFSRKNIPFIFRLHTIYDWLHIYVYLIPLIRPYDIILAPSQYGRKSFLKICYKQNIFIIFNFFDTKFINQNINYNPKKNEKILAFIGRLSKEKGLGLLIKIMPDLRAKLKNVCLNIIGPLSGWKTTNYPKDSYVKYLQGRVKKHNLISQIRFTGVKFGISKYRELSKTDLVINPTTAIEDIFPRINIESLACGVPVIATDWAGNKEIIKDGYNGYLVNVDKTPGKKPKVDTQQMVDLIVKVLKDKKLLAKLKKNALKSAEAYDYRKVMPKLIRLLKNRKSQSRIKSRWEEIKDKTPVDFAHLFNKDFLFFLYSDNIFRTVTYDMLCKSIIKGQDFKKSFPKKRKILHNKTSNDITNKIRQNCLDYLLLRNQ
jgi:glycosyltransferase involved in cell wall biosynthesis